MKGQGELDCGRTELHSMPWEQLHVPSHAVTRPFSGFGVSNSLLGPLPGPMPSGLDLGFVRHVPETFCHERQFGQVAASTESSPLCINCKLIYAHG